MVDQNNRPKPAMGDIRPRRSMDMGRPSGMPDQPRPQPPVPAPVRPQPIAQAPMADPRRQRPQPLPQRPISAPALPQARPVGPQAATRPPKVKKARPFWRGFLQVLVSLLVIVGVAAVIVALYIRYYQ